MKIQSLVISRIEGPKKFQAVFEFTEDGKKRKKTIKFGQTDAEDYTIHRDDDRKRAYISRHRSNEDWDNPLTAGALSRWILWEKRTLREGIMYFKEKFNIP